MTETTMNFIFALIAIVVVVIIIQWITGKTRMSQLEEKVRQLENNLQEKDHEINQLKAERTKFIFKSHSLKNSISGVRGMVRDTLKSVESLTGLLNYMLYDSEEKYVKISEDVEFTEHLFNLYKHAVNPNAVCKFIVSPELKKEFSSYKIMPWAFVPMLENAFEHGNKESIHFELIFEITTIEQKRVCCQIENTLESKSSTSHGIGIETLKERIAYYYTENQYKITMEQIGNRWVSKLELDMLS